MGGRLPLLLLAAACAKAVIQKTRKHGRHGAHRHATASKEAGTACSAGATATQAPRHASQGMSCAPSADMSAPDSRYTPIPLLLSQLSLILQTSLAALASTAMADLTPVMTAAMHCHWMLRWLLAVQVNAAEAFAADFELGRWAMRQSQPSINPPAVAGTGGQLAAEPQQPPAYQRCSWLSGSWQCTKGWDAVENQPSAADLLQLGGVARTGMRMFKGMEFFVSHDKLYLTATTKLPWLKVSPEAYLLDGGSSNHNRRDMRKGKLTGHVEVHPDGGVDLFYQWDAPTAGHAVDEMRLVGKDELLITTHLTVNGTRGSYCVQYKRSGSAKRPKSARSTPAVTPAPSLPNAPSMPRVSEHSDASNQRGGMRGPKQLVT